MSEIVRTCVPPADAGRNSFEPLLEGMDCVMLSRLIRKNQIVGVVPCGANFQAVFQLLHPLGPEILKSDGRRLDGTGFAAFRSGGNVIFRVR